MTDRPDPLDADLDRLVQDAVADVDPPERLREIRDRTGRGRGRWYAAGALLTAAATVAAFALLGGGSPGGTALDPAEQPTATEAPVESESVALTPLYWVGDTPYGPRLFREPTFLSPGYGQSLLTAAVRRVVEGEASDPDYRSAWAGGQVRSARRVDGEVRVVVDFPTDGGPSDLGVEQVAATAWAVVGSQVPVTVTVRTKGPMTPVTVTALDDLAVMSLVQVDSPAEGEVVEGSFLASGLSSSFEATTVWRIEDEQGRVVDEYSTPAEGWVDGLYPWETTIDVSDLDPGTYTFVAATDDPTGGTEGNGPFTDTRTIVVAAPGEAAPASEDSPVLTEDGEVLVSCGGGDITWRPSTMPEGIPGILDEAEVRQAFRDLLADPRIAGEAELTFLRDGVDGTAYRVLGADGDVVVLGLGTWDERGPVDGSLVMSIEREGDRWAFAGGGSCRLEVQLTEPEGQPSWVEVTGREAGAGTAIRVLVNERQCTSGRDPLPHLREPQVTYAEDEVVVYWTSDPGTGGTCVGIPPVTTTLDLDEPLGDRVLLDGSTWPPRPVLVTGE